MALALDASLVYHEITPVDDCRVNVVRHVWPVEFTSHSTVPSTLAQVFSQFLMMDQIEEA